MNFHFVAIIPYKFKGISRIFFNFEPWNFQFYLLINLLGLSGCSF